MNIDELKNAKITLEQRIGELVRGFENETQTHVSSVSLNKEYPIAKPLPQVLTVTVKVEV